MNSTLVIIPAFNEEKSIGRIVKGIREKYPQYKVVVIDDGSTDETRKISIESGATVLSHTNNLGYGVALQTGYKYCLKHTNYDCLVQLDGDGQHDYSEIERLIAPLYQKKADLVIGSRFLSKERSIPIPIVRRFGILFFRSLLYLLTKKRIKDITSGLQAFNRRVLLNYVSDEFPYYYPDANVLLLLLREGVTIDEIPSTMSKNEERKSMHKGWGRQIYYVIAMILSFAIVLLKNLGRKHAH